jgi:hypothetical protein
MCYLLLLLYLYCTNLDLIVLNADTYRINMSVCLCVSLVRCLTTTTNLHCILVVANTGDRVLAVC